MSLSENIKRLRLDKGLTQEKLANILGISAQAVSKWENSETYPDGALLVPLAKALDVSLDELFDNGTVSMADLSRRILTVISKANEKERFNIARNICWQIEKGLFGNELLCGEKYDPNEL